MNNIELKNNSMQAESFIAISRLVLVILGTAGYFAVMERSEFSLWDMILFIAVFYYSFQIAFLTCAMGRALPGWITAAVDSLFV